MRKFWVIFKHNHGRDEVKKAMCGNTARQVAWEIRQKYPDAKIEAIHVIRQGVAVAHR